LEQKFNEKQMMKFWTIFQEAYQNQHARLEFPHDYHILTKILEKESKQENKHNNEK
jgi:hypothetical protein